MIVIQYSRKGENLNLQILGVPLANFEYPLGTESATETVENERWSVRTNHRVSLQEDHVQGTWSSRPRQYMQLL